jgi:hypothetical protein
LGLERIAAPPEPRGRQFEDVIHHSKDHVSRMAFVDNGAGISQEADNS